MRKLPLAALLLLSGSPLLAAEPCITLDSRSVAALFDDWNFALSSLDSRQVVQRYWPDAVLLPTVSNTPRTNSALIGEYFDHFLTKRPRGHIDTRTIQSTCNLAVDMGTYTFSLMDDKGTTSEVAARYTFVYQHRDGAWKILHHHSSAMPERVPTAADAQVEPAPGTDASVEAKPAKSPPTRAQSRKQRKALRQETARPAAAAVSSAAKPAPVAESKPDSVTRPVVDTKAVSASRPVAETKAAVTDAKAAAEPKSPDKAMPESKTPTAAAAPADARLPPEVRTAMFANLTSSPPPSQFYPPEAARRKERGNVNLKVCADGAGTVSDTLEVLKSSGSQLLDEAAMSWARAVTWVPATYNNRRVEGCAKVDVWFEPPPALARTRP